MESSVKGLLLKFKSLLGLIVLCVVISILTPRFLSISNIMNVFTQVSVNAILAIGMSFVILTGGIDLSVGSTLAISGAVSASLIKSTNNIFLSLIVAVAIGATIGLMNGLVVSRGKIQAFIVTLATMTIFRGVTVVYTNGTPISGLSDAFMKIGNKKIGGYIPVPAIITGIILFIAWYILNETRYGRYVYAIGGNEDSARLSGINTDKVKTFVYVLCGITAAISGVITTSRVGSASPNAGSGFELDAIAAVVVGGTSLAGGEGTVIGTIIGAMIIGVLNNGLNLAGVSAYYQSIVKGLVILLAVLIDRKSK
ncbi:ribose ABC transporter permease [Clostridium sp. MSJ-11]|uniref:Ribose ABC transporter permease n=1 Tax=Clostridium mobile TaxID=2841512 RepID=A0ABS6EMS6_9CLOT|nr:ribose ABC transporter permease [Clostridium mobile]MBU5486542.1 ribose ABC transporter permease [Clostridium mobile]